MCRPCYSACSSTSVNESRRADPFASFRYPFLAGKRYSMLRDVYIPMLYDPVGCRPSIIVCDFPNQSWHTAQTKVNETGSSLIFIFLIPRIAVVNVL